MFFLFTILMLNILQFFAELLLFFRRSEGRYENKFITRVLIILYCLKPFKATIFTACRVDGGTFNIQSILMIVLNMLVNASFGRVTKRSRIEMKQSEVTLCIRIACLLRTSNSNLIRVGQISCNQFQQYLIT